MNRRAVFVQCHSLMLCVWGRDSKYQFYCHWFKPTTIHTWGDHTNLNTIKVHALFFTVLYGGKRRHFPYTKCIVNKYICRTMYAAHINDQSWERVLRKVHISGEQHFHLDVLFGSLYSTREKIQFLHMEYISLSWSDIPKIMVPFRISLIKGY